MNYSDALSLVINPGLNLLPPPFTSDEARILMLTIGMQESRFEHRKQLGGPARGFFQFESGGGYHGVVRHHATGALATRVLSDLHIPPWDGFDAIQFNDTLAAAFARLLIYTDPAPLPSVNAAPDVWWDYYLRCWRPGKPHRSTWDSFLIHAKDAVLTS